MTAGLDPIDLGPDMVGVVDHPMRQPEQPLFDGLEMVDRGRAHLWLRGKGAAIDREGCQPSL